MPHCKLNDYITHQLRYFLQTKLHVWSSWVVLPFTRKEKRNCLRLKAIHTQKPAKRRRRRRTTTRVYASLPVVCQTIMGFTIGTIIGTINVTYFHPLLCHSLLSPSRSRYSFPFTQYTAYVVYQITFFRICCAAIVVA